MKSNLKNTKPFKKNDPRINKKGRPRKLVSSVLKELEDKGVERVTSEQIKGIFEVMINLTEVELKELMSDNTQPILNRIVAKQLLDKKGFEIIEKILDRVHGKAIQKTENKSETTVKTEIPMIEFFKNANSKD